MSPEIRNRVFLDGECVAESHFDIGTILDKEAAEWERRMAALCAEAEAWMDSTRRQLADPSDVQRLIDNARTAE